MGNRFSRQNEGVEDLDFSSNPYRYPPPSGKRAPFSRMIWERHFWMICIKRLLTLENDPNHNILYTGKNYFADYFLMGGSKFDSPQPEAYLFGENNDLNLLNPKPVSVRACNIIVVKGIIVGKSLLPYADTKFTLSSFKHNPCTSEDSYLISTELNES